MSIISDALKKASREKIAGPEAAAERIVKPRKYVGKPAVEAKVAKKGANKRLIILSGIIGLLGFGVLLAYLVRESTVKGKLAEIVSSSSISEKEPQVLPPQEAKEAFIKESIVLVPKAPSLHLTGIIWGFGRPAAFINGMIVGEGDIVGGAKVLEIRQKEVRLNFEGEDLLLTLKR